LWGILGLGFINMLLSQLEPEGKEKRNSQGIMRIEV